MKRKMQIGVMGSAADLAYADNIAALAEQIGEEIARRGGVLFYGAERDYDSLSTAASRGAKRAGGFVVGVTYGKSKEIRQPSADVIIFSGLERGGGREFVLSASCDSIISVSGGSGTLNELLVAYQLDIPMVGLRGTGGVTDMFVDKYFDARQRRMLIGADTAEQAVELAYQEIAKLPYANTLQL